MCASLSLISAQANPCSIISSFFLLLLDSIFSTHSVRIELMPTSSFEPLFCSEFSPNCRVPATISNFFRSQPDKAIVSVQAILASSLRPLQSSDGKPGPALALHPFGGRGGSPNSTSQPAKGAPVGSGQNASDDASRRRRQKRCKHPFGCHRQVSAAADARPCCAAAAARAAPPPYADSAPPAASASPRPLCAPQRR